MKDRIRFPPNIQVPLALIDVDGQFLSYSWGDQVLYETCDGRMFYASMALSTKINFLDLHPGEHFTITKRWNGLKGPRSQTRWDVERIASPQVPPVPARNPHDPTDLELQLKASIENVKAARKDPSTPPPAAPTPEPSRPTIVRSTKRQNDDNRQLSFPWEAELSRRSQALVDTYAKTLEYANEKHGAKVPSDDVRSLIITAYIGLTNRRGGNSNVA